MKEHVNTARIAVAMICLASSGCAFLITDTYKTERYEAVHEATLNGERAKMNEMLDARPRLVNVRDENDNTLLHLAVLRNEVIEVQDLLTRRANVNAINSAGMTPLHLAAKLGEVEIAKVLIAYKPDLSIRDRRGWTPLMWAENTHHSKITNLLQSAEIQRR